MTCNSGINCKLECQMWHEIKIFSIGKNWENCKARPSLVKPLNEEDNSRKQGNTVM